MIKKIIKNAFEITGYSINRKINKEDQFAGVMQILGFEVDKTKFDYLQRGIDILKELKTKRNAVYIKKEDDLIIQIENLYFI